MAEEKDKDKILAPIGMSGLERSGGYIYEEQLRQLQGDRWIKTVEQMLDQSGIISSSNLANTLLVRQAPWSVRPYSDDPIAMMQSQFIDDAFGDMSRSMSDTMSDIASFMAFGFQATELLYKRRLGMEPAPVEVFDYATGKTKMEIPPSSKFDDGRIGWRRWDGRAQNTVEKWGFDQNGSIAGLYQQAAPAYITQFIHIERLLLFRTTARKNNPEGRSIYRGAYNPWYFSSNIKRIEGIGIERDLAGLPVFFVPGQIMASDASASEKAALATCKNIVTNVRRDEQEGLLVSSDRDEGGNLLYEFKLLSSGGSRQFDTNKIIDRYDREMARAVFAEIVIMGNANASIFDSNSSGVDLFVTALGAFLDQIAATINAHAIPRLLKLNGMDTSLAPKFVFGDIRKVSLQGLADFIQKISGAGAMLFPDDDLEAYLREQAGLPVAQQ